ncbi:hypothetical protein NDU88_002815 [Pleurodeles waltl]|uniref:DDE Tnp4 domain-containing protein n=1 Tax=Pleurodeles waltl TaxID=8319 RepID=A0AAV7WR92_PLEWA|nr:hypothetical protein NDU88_002815 [Pleurodeles waltl]
MQDCAAVFDRLPRRYTTPAQLPHIPLSHITVLTDSVLAVLVHRARPLGQGRRWRHPPAYRPLVDLSTMEDRHIIITYRLDRATIQELCAQLEPDLISAIRHPTGIPPLVQVLSVLHFLASGSFQTTVAIASGMSQPMFSNVLTRVLSALLKHMRSYIVFPQVEDLPTVKGDFYALGHIPNIIGAIDGTHVALVLPAHCPSTFAGDSGYPNLSWLLTPVRNPRTRAEERYNEAHGRTRRVIERTFGLLKARFRCLHMTGGSLYYSPKKVCQIIVACCMLHNLALQRQVPFLQEDGPEGGLVAAVHPVDSEEEEAEEEDIDKRNNVIQQYFQ